MRSSFWFTEVLTYFQASYVLLVSFLIFYQLLFCFKSMGFQSMNFWCLVDCKFLCHIHSGVTKQSFNFFSQLSYLCLKINYCIMLLYSDNPKTFFLSARLFPSTFNGLRSVSLNTACFTSYVILKCMLLSPYLLFLPHSLHYKRFLICFPTFSSASKNICACCCRSDDVMLLPVIPRCSSRSLAGPASLTRLDQVPFLILPFALPNCLLVLHMPHALPPTCNSGHSFLFLPGL